MNFLFYNLSYYFVCSKNFNKYKKKLIKESKQSNDPCFALLILEIPKFGTIGHSKFDCSKC